MVKTILFYQMVNRCIHISVHEFESDSISPVPSLSFLLNQGWGGSFVIVSTADCHFKDNTLVIETINLVSEY
jgi:hypothetical protein